MVPAWKIKASVWDNPLRDAQSDYLALSDSRTQSAFMHFGSEYSLLKKKKKSLYLFYHEVEVSLNSAQSMSNLCNDILVSNLFLKFHPYGNFYSNIEFKALCRFVLENTLNHTWITVLNLLNTTPQKQYFCNTCSLKAFRRKYCCSFILFSTRNTFPEFQLYALN